VALVGQAMDKLPRHIRTTFESVLEGERSYEEAARELAIPVGTLRSRVSRVRAAVRSQFCVTKN
jgi:DNA-directed RNA polymerase specialized sigma24 family protein